MKSKLVLLTTCVSLVASICIAQESYTVEYRKALRDGAKAKMTVAVSSPVIGVVSNAHVSVYFERSDGNQYTISGQTDLEGYFTAVGTTRSSVGGSVSKQGYYRSTFRIPFATGQERIDGDRWLPWNPTIPLVLREERKPMPLYVKRFSGRFPNGVTVGFDCKEGDFVNPHGTGKTADFTIYVKVGGDTRTAIKAIALGTPDPAGGFAILTAYGNSAFKSEYLAPESGYTTNLTAASSYEIGGKGFEGTVLYDYGDKYGTYRDYLVFKSRIERDREGNVISANYGKVYGEFQFGRGEVELKTAHVNFLYYFNPTPNDRNLEFDGKNNLFKPGWKSTLRWSQEP